MQIVDEYVDDLIEVVKETTGTELTGYRRTSLKSRLIQRIERLGMDAGQYLGYCRNSSDECRVLVNACAINVSSFFRDPVVFDIIAQSVLPPLMARDGALRVWSAGCAAGEEAYSIAILVAEALGRRPDIDFQPLIFATDLKREVLEQAKLATYSRDSLKDAKLGLVDSYFFPVGDRFELHPEIKKMVYFSVDDLLSPKTAVPKDSIYGAFDIVLCRNVLIYFSAKRQAQVQEKLYESLAKGGILVLGDSEDVSHELKQRLETMDARNRIFKKPF